MKTRFPLHPTLAATLVAGAALLPGCRDTRSDKPPHQFFPDMDDQPKWNPQSRSEFFTDQRTMRQPVPGVVPFGRVQFVSSADWAQPFMQQRDDLLKDDDAVYLGLDADGAYLRDIPLEVTQRLIRRGQERFNIYCAVCHGFDGSGKGMVGEQWSYPLPTFHDDKYIDKANSADMKAYDGYIFHVIRNGVVLEGQQKMPPYDHAVDEHDAWAIVSYVRALQASRRGALEDVGGEALQQDLSRRRPAVTPAAPAAPGDSAGPGQSPASAPGAGGSTAPDQPAGRQPQPAQPPGQGVPPQQPDSQQPRQPGGAS